MSEHLLPPASIIVGLWLLFAGSHVLLSSCVLRERLIRHVGISVFRGIYSLIAFASFAPLVLFYMNNRHSGTLLWWIERNAYLDAGINTGMALAVVLITASLMSPSPTMVGQAAKRSPFGVSRITRHALFMGIALWALLHVIANGFVGDIVFFGGFVVFSVFGAWHQDQRYISTRDISYIEFMSQAPFFPFTGRDTRLGIAELPRSAVIISVVATVLLHAMH